MPSVVDENWARTVPVWPGSGNQNNSGGDPNIRAGRTNYVNSNHGGLTGTSILRAFLWAVLLFSIIAVSMYSALFFSPPLPDFQIDERHCLCILSTIKSLEYFPFPHPIDRRVHGGLLKKLGRPEILRHLEDARSDAISTLAATEAEIVSFFAKGAQNYSRYPSKDTFIAIYHDIDILHKRLNETVAQLDTLANIYEPLRDDYQMLSTITSETFKEGHLSQDDDFWVCAQAELRLWPVFFNAAKEILEPLRENTKTMEEARLGLVVLERDTRAIQQIIRVVQEMGRGLWHLTTSLPPRDTATSDHSHASGIARWTEGWLSLLQALPGSRTLNPPDSTQRWLSAWFRQQVNEISPLKKLWMEALSSLDDEQKLPIELKTQWCERVET
ncbi:MAG: hypothetical protein Q9208_007183 [Pyrenodesmia sp. 3 TL-2023]